MPAVDPIHYDKAGAGVGPGKSFALVLADNVHFDAPSARELGRRYAAAYLQLQAVDRQ